MKKSIVFFENIGEIELIPKRGIKRISIRIKPFALPCLTFPAQIRKKDILNFILSRQEWIERGLKRQAAKEKKEKEIETFLESIDIVAAKKFLKERTAELAENFGYKFTRVTIRKQKTRWGSCSAKNAISLNIKLIALDQDVRDYVIIHELVHTKHKNHQKGFWNEVSSLVPDYKEMEKKLKSV